MVPKLTVVLVIIVDSAVVSRVAAAGVPPIPIKRVVSKSQRTRCFGKMDITYTTVAETAVAGAWFRTL